MGLWLGVGRTIEHEALGGVVEIWRGGGGSVTLAVDGGAHSLGGSEAGAERSTVPIGTSLCHHQQTC